MGRIAGYICQDCGLRFKASEGDLMLAVRFECDECHRVKMVPRAGGRSSAPIAIVSSCECGGTYGNPGPVRCPNCDSTDLEGDPDVPILFVD